jgi:selenocysteine-specific elongation factor
MRALERLEQELEAAGFAVPDTPAWTARLGAAASEVAALGHFLGRLVRVSQEFTLTARQAEELRARLAGHFARSPALAVAEFRELAGVSRKWAVPLLEHADRVGWTVRVGDERKPGPRLGG